MGLDAILRPRLCELGKIKIGRLEDKVRKSAGGNEWRAPQKLDHFVITTLQRTAKGDLAPDSALMEQLGTKYADPDGKLRQVPITLLSDDPEDVMQSAYVWYGGKKVIARSDGETLTKYVDHKTKEPLDPPQQTPWKPEYGDMKDAKGNPFFKVNTVLNCVIASDNAKWGGVYKFRTTSRITADQLYGSLIHLKQLTGGVLRGLPLVLVVRPMQVAPNGTATTVYVVHVELHGADLRSVQQIAMVQAQWQLENATQMRQMQAQYQRLLRAPGEGESPEEVADVTAEFYPPEESNGHAEPEPPDDHDPLVAAMGMQSDAPPATDDPPESGNDGDDWPACACPDGPAGQHEEGCEVAP